ncbi:MAG: ADP-glyceromanno-heptose 6-epimerase [Bacteroidetes bacterium]|nr:ADP-glyceromanno-heptose 6-epimerase [Bacteroidota bacterium]
MIIISGASGFIGSCLVSYLNSSGITNLILIDKFDNKEKLKNLQNKHYSSLIDRDDFHTFIHENDHKIDFFFHLGARTDTGETNKSVFDKLNLNFSKDVWIYCCNNDIPLIYASSAATYGNGDLGFNDEDSETVKLMPLNEYASSKHTFDKWVLEQSSHPSFWYGFKFFNVFGPNEYHKARMASVILHAYHQLKEKGKIQLFKSHANGISDGEQKRDFIYIKDLLKVLDHFYTNKPQNGLYNLGSGKAHSFNNLALAVFKALDLSPKIEYIETPEKYRKNYQYFTEAKIDKLKNAGYTNEFMSFESSVKDYVQEYLSTEKYL